MTNKKITIKFLDSQKENWFWRLGFYDLDEDAIYLNPKLSMGFNIFVLSYELAHKRLRSICKKIIFPLNELLTIPIAIPLIFVYLKRAKRILMGKLKRELID